MPDRESETFARWLKANPGVEVISRDRSEKYAAGSRQGAPEATHVADRWHLLSNWRRAIETVVDRHRGRIKRVTLPAAESAGKPAAAVLPAKSVNRRRKRCTEAESTALAQLRDAHTEITATIWFTERFLEIVRERQGEKLVEWLSDAEGCGIREIWRFAHKVRQDEAAVQADRKHNEQICALETHCVRSGTAFGSLVVRIRL